MKKFLLTLLICLSLQPVIAQEFEAGLQIRPRLEFRNGFKTLLPENTDPAVFVSQRSRANLNYEQEFLKMRVSLQNVHIWGDTPTTALTERNGFKFFEAYADYSVTPAFGLKLGRQELSYDNQRIFGGLDWAQQGQSHDAFLVSMLPGANQQLDLGFAMNAEIESLIDLPYTANSYKSMQFAWYHINFRVGGFSFLFLNNGYEHINQFTAAIEVQYQQTFGSFFRFAGSDFSGDLAAYGQTGERSGRDLKAYYLGGNILYSVAEAWRAGLGAEFLSGTDSNDQTGKNRSFIPLFGTNHGFNGFMDYFYVGNHINSVGLLDVYGKLSFVHQKFQISAIPHLFWSAADLHIAEGGNESNYLGTEVDFAGSYRLQKDIALSFGYSQMFGTESLEVLKGGNHNRLQNWAWVMISFQPKIFSSTAASNL